MTIDRLISLTAMAVAAATLASRPATAADLVYGSWTPAQEYQNRVLMPELFKISRRTPTAPSNGS